MNFEAHVVSLPGAEERKEHFIVGPNFQSKSVLFKRAATLQ